MIIYIARMGLGILLAAIMGTAFAAQESDAQAVAEVLADSVADEATRSGLTYYNYYNTYMYIERNGSFIGANKGIAKRGKRYPYPQGELVYYCQQSEPRAGACCDNIVENAIEIYVCDTMECKTGRFHYLSSENNKLLGTSFARSLFADPRSNDTTIFKLCR